MKAKHRNVRKRVAIMTTMMSMALAAMPGMNAFASTSTVEVPSSGQQQEHIRGVFDVTESDLQEMGYSATVVYPIYLDMDYDGDARAYVGSDEIYAKGVVLDGKKVQITIDTASELYGRIYDTEASQNLALSTQDFVCTLSKEKWTSEECYSNLQADVSLSSIPSKGSVSISLPVKNFLPRKPDVYMTYVPFTVKLVEE